MVLRSMFFAFKEFSLPLLPYQDFNYIYMASFFLLVSIKDVLQGIVVTGKMEGVHDIRISLRARIYYNLRNQAGILVLALKSRIFLDGRRKELLRNQASCTI